MAIWRRNGKPEEIMQRLGGSLATLLGIRILEVGPDWLRAEMPVDDRHLQPHGILHGGASVVISETLGSVASALASPEGTRVVGLEVNANHLAAVPGGETVSAICRPLHVGRSTQVWQTEIRRRDGRLACVSRLTTMILPAGD